MFFSLLLSGVLSFLILLRYGNKIEVKGKTLIVKNLLSVQKSYDLEKVHKIDIHPDRVFYKKTILLRIKKLNSYRTIHLGTILTEGVDALYSFLKEKLPEISIEKRL